MRGAIARRLLESKTQLPHFYVEIEVDAAPLLAIREQLNRGLEAEGVKSPVYTLRVADVPYVQKMQLEYVFPSYTGLEKETIDGADVARLIQQGLGDPGRSPADDGVARPS